MRTTLLAATALVALSPLAVAQDQIVVTEPVPRAKPPEVRVNDGNVPGGRLHYDVPCRVSPEGTCITEPPAYPPHRARP
jgi:hypothetical protein